MRVLTLALASTLAQAISLWDPTGPYHVGYTQHLFNHTIPDDPTSVLLTIYYPTLQTPDATIPYLDPISAKIFESTIGLQSGILGNLTTRLQWQAPTLFNTGFFFQNATSPFPTLIFVPGAALPTVAYTAYLSDLASHGFAVVAIDHPGEPPYLPLPGGGGVYGYPNFASFPPTLADGARVYAYRVSDILAVLSDPYLPSLVRQTGSPFNLTHIGVFGHSIGGAAAAAAMAESESGVNPNLKAGANLDGTFFQLANPATTKLDVGARGPFLEVGAENHFNGDPRSDGTWVRFNAAQTGWVREVQVAGTRHLDFSDIPLWIELLGQGGVMKGGWVGSGGGKEGTRLTSSTLR